MFNLQITFHSAAAALPGRRVEQFGREPAVGLRQRVGEGVWLKERLPQLSAIHADSDEWLLV